jgi:hypothetical protein
MVTHNGKPMNTLTAMSESLALLLIAKHSAAIDFKKIRPPNDFWLNGSVQSLYLVTSSMNRAVLMRDWL